METKNLKGNLAPKTDEEKALEVACKAHNIGNKNKVSLERSLRQLIIAVSANRTCVNYGKKHFCRKHGVVINKAHIN